MNASLYVSIIVIYKLLCYNSSMKKQTSISLVLPAFNEESQIARTVEQAHYWLKHQPLRGEIIVVNNGSTDNTGKILHDLSHIYKELVIVRHKHNQGYARSVRSGCDAAKMDIIAYMDSDGQYDVEDIGRLIPQIQNADFVAGVRRKRQDSAVRKLNSVLWNSLIKILFRIHAKDIDCGMKIFKRSIWPLIRPIYATGNLFSTELFLRLKLRNIKWVQIKIRHFPRLHGSATGSQFVVIFEAFSQLWTLLRNKDRIPHSFHQPSPTPY